MSVYTAFITKKSKDQSIGIVLAHDPDKGLIISSIDSEGLLGQSLLREGMRLLTINNIPVNCLSSTKEAVKILKEAEGKLVLTATTEELVPANITFRVDCKAVRGDNGKLKYYSYTDSKMNRDINNAMPTILKEAGVSLGTFCRIYKLVDSELLPTAVALKSHEFIYQNEMDSYTYKQVVKAGNLGAESNREKKVFHMVTQGAQLQRNVDLKVTQVKDRTNAMLAKYNIMATIAIEATTLPKYSTKQPKANEVLHVVGLEFHQVEQ